MCVCDSVAKYVLTVGVRILRKTHSPAILCSAAKPPSFTKILHTPDGEEKFDSGRNIRWGDALRNKYQH